MSYTRRSPSALRLDMLGKALLLMVVFQSRSKSLYESLTKAIVLQKNTIALSVSAQIVLVPQCPL